MEITKDNNSISVFNKDFNIQEILDCGQVFSYKKLSAKEYVVVSLDKVANIKIGDEKTVINTKFVDYFYNYFDLDTDYEEIKKEICTLQSDFDKFFCGGNSIRILRQDAYQTIISFIVSANNNIKRIKKILFAISQKFGQKLSDDLFSFPTAKQLMSATEEDFKKLGAGYRSAYLVDTIKMLQTQDFDIEKLKQLDTKSLKQRLLQLKGVGNKVADCILLFGFARTDVFPVDTWIRKAYSFFCNKKRNDKQISEYFVDLFKNCSGYAQQYIFNYMITSKAFYNKG